MSAGSTNATLITLEQAHGTVMIFAWIAFASTGILLARYGRQLRFGDKSKLFGVDIWFQMHRSILVLAAVATLLGLLLVLLKGNNEAVARNRDTSRMTAHQFLGYIVVGGTVLQVGMGLFRCAPQSPHRFIFNWIHRSIVASVLRNYPSGLMIILSLWTGWIVIIVIVFEIIKFRCQSKPSTVGIKIINGEDAHELNNETLHGVPNASVSQTPELEKFNNSKLFLLASHFVVAMSLAISLVALLWQQ